MREEEIIKQIVAEVLEKIQKEQNTPLPTSKKSQEVKERIIYCNYSNRHCHLSREAVDALFGEGYQLKVYKNLMQPGEFAAEEIITIVGPKGDTLPLRVLGPIRSKTQVEISRTDSYTLKMPYVPVRESGNLEGTPGAVLVGPKGAYNLKEGVIVAKRHIHFTPEDAEYFGVKDKQILQVKIDSPDRSLIFGDVVARVKPNYALEMHIDVDEANAAGIGNMTPVTIIKDW